MIRSDLKLTIPNPHRGDVSRDELEEVLEGWIKLGSVDIHCHSERSEESKDLALPATILRFFTPLRSVQNLHSLVKAT